MNNLLLSLAILVTSSAFSGCAGIRPRYHEVQTGESLPGIAAKYEVPVAALEKSNAQVAAAPALKPGTKLYVPFEANPRFGSEGASRELTTAEGEVKSPEIGSVKFAWPVSGGHVTSLFGYRVSHRKEAMHEGIDIGARTGVKVSAARSGHVIYAGNKIRGYGNLIIIRHADTYSTVYAHLSKMNVKKGQFVSRGQKIGAVGRTGRAHGSHLHFEVRDKQTPVDPMLFLQGQYASNVVSP